jgi:hypothetical protein
MPPSMLFSAFPKAQGLYDPENEADSCGLAMVADGLTALEHLENRGLLAPGTNSGDGAGSSSNCRSNCCARSSSSTCRHRFRRRQYLHRRYLPQETAARAAARESSRPSPTTKTQGTRLADRARRSPRGRPRRNCLGAHHHGVLGHAHHNAAAAILYGSARRARPQRHRDLAQPILDRHVPVVAPNSFRFVVHSGEINTVRGICTHACEAMLSSAGIPGDLPASR